MDAQPILATDQPAQVIVVTGRALPDPAPETLLDTVTLDERDLRLSPTRRVDQLLKQVPGVQLFRRSDAASANPTSQGLTLRGLGGNAASRALVVLDGVPQSDPFGGWINWPAFSLLDLTEVRVVRGGGSVSYGPGALAGAVLLTSAADPGTAAELEVGSRRALEGRLSTGIALGAGRLQLGAQAARGDGFIPIVADQRGPGDRPSSYHNAAARLRWLVPVAANTELQANLAGFVDRRERGLAFTGNTTRGLDGSVRLVNRGRLPWTLLGYAQARRFSSSFASVDDERTEARRVSLQDHVPGRVIGWSAEVRPSLGPGLQLRLGTDARFARGRSEELTNYVDAEPTRDRVAGGRSSTAGAFAELGWTSGPVSLSGAVRLDRWRIADGIRRERSLLTGAVLTDERFPSRTGWLPTGRAAAGLELGQGLSLRGAAYAGWRLPTLNELFRPFRAGTDATAANPLLKPERLVGAEAGLRWEGSSANLSLTAFANRLRDPIANVTLGQGPGLFPGVGFVAAGGAYRQRQNLNAIRVRGVEATGGWRSGPWSLTAAASFVDSSVDGQGASAELDGLQPAQTPRHSASVGGSWDDRGRSASLLFRYVGKQWEDDLNQTRVPGALTVDAAGTWPISRRLQVQFRAENLLDKRVVAAISNDGLTERATPRTLWLGLRLSAPQAN